MGSSDLTAGVAADAAAAASGTAGCAFCTEELRADAEGAASGVEMTSSGAVGAA